MRAKKILEVTNRKQVAWCDNNKALWGKYIAGIQVISPSELINNFENAIVIITASRHMWNIHRQLLIMGFLQENIFIPINRFLLGTRGIQYFDMFESKNNEIFIDAGCWDGATSRDFVNWCKKEYKKIYAFEPDELCWRRCEDMFERENIENIQFIKKGTWKKTAELYLKGAGVGNSVVNDKMVSATQVPVVSIDDILCGEEVTFIKMDVEGSEMETLEGAKESIKRYKPRLAVSVYHKPEDLWILAEYILELNEKYKLYLRHYTTCNYETVLYAI